MTERVSSPRACLRFAGLNCFQRSLLRLLCLCKQFLGILIVVGLSGCGSIAGLDSAIDSDGDGVSDRRERALGTDPASSDTDLDGLLDGDELTGGTSPLTADSDRDGVPDGSDPTPTASSRNTGSVSTGNDLEPNDLFDLAPALANVGAGMMTFEGRIDLLDDVDVFALGPVFPGDRVTIDYHRIDERFRPIVALFDEAGVLLESAKDRFVSGGPALGRLIDRVVRRGSSNYFLAVTHSTDDSRLGGYRFDVAVEHGGAVPEARSQVLYLDFDGGTLEPALLGVTYVAPFDAASISPLFRGEDERIKRMVIATVRRHFEPFGVTVLTSNEDPNPPDVCAATLILGSFHEEILGVANGVDPLNSDLCDDGVVFTESFTAAAFGFTPTASAVGLAIGNVAAHEAGHLLGLYHVADPSAVMDERSASVHLLTRQEFTEAPLSPSVFPIGLQDAPGRLREVLGTSPAEFKVTFLHGLVPRVPKAR